MHRNRASRIRQPALELANTLAFLVALAGTVVGLSEKVATGALTVGCVVVVLLYAALTIIRVWPRRYDFKTGSKKYVKFFSAWYARPGAHTIYCDNLRWLDEPFAEPIRNAIMHRGDQTHVYVRDTSGRAAQQLRNSGVTLHVIPERVQVHAKISVVSDDGFQQMIIRTEAEKDGRIRFQRFGSDILTQLMIGFISSCDTP